MSLMRSRPMKTLIFGLATSLLAALPAFADVHLTMHDGRVSIVAKEATVRQILTEWARVGQTRPVGVRLGVLLGVLRAAASRVPTGAAGAAIPAGSRGAPGR